jgi:hypothetical protein
LALKGQSGAAVVDRWLSLPEVWAREEKRRVKASGLPDLVFTRKNAIADDAKGHRLCAMSLGGATARPR